MEGGTGGNATPLKGLYEEQKPEAEVKEEPEKPKKPNKYAYVKSKFLTSIPKSPLPPQQIDTISNPCSTTSSHLTNFEATFHAPTSQELLKHSPYL